ncbi:MAG: ferredoxin-like protein [Comamonadaceae bacterium]|nr:MAG: ferredoxin-like protein [Comamonadaceae bacterium]
MPGMNESMTSPIADSMPVATPASYYQRHIFFCLNERSNGEECCAKHDAQAAFDHCKARVKAAGLAGPGQVRVNKAGCLDRCAAGPVVVVYPEAVWYSYVDVSDIDEIVESHLKNGQVVQRLLTPAHLGR